MCRWGVNEDTLTLLYKLYATPVMEYGVEVWGDTSGQNMSKLDVIQHLVLC